MRYGGCIWAYMYLVYLCASGRICVYLGVCAESGHDWGEAKRGAGAAVLRPLATLNEYHRFDLTI